MTHLYADWRQVPGRAWPWENFGAAEMACRATGQVFVVPDFMDRLQALRELLAFPLHVTSGYREPAYNARVSSTGREGPHTTGRAVDIAIWGERAVLLIDNARAHGFSGIGLRQHGPRAARFVHLDDLDLAELRPRYWTYP